MIYLLLNTLSERMNEFLCSYYNRAEVMVEAGIIEATPDEDQTDKIILSVVNIERETAMGISGHYRGGADRVSQRISPPWHLNIYVMVAAVFSSKRYMESLRVLSDSISFLQQHPRLTWMQNEMVTIEPVTVSMQELSNIWGVLGGHYYPSVLCKIRVITFDGTELKGVIPEICEQNVNTKVL